MGKNHQAVFGIFDGHSGAKASQFWRDNIKRMLEEQYENLKDSTIPTIKNSKHLDIKGYF